MTLDVELAKLNEIVGAVDVPFEAKSLDVEGDGTLILCGLAAGFNTDRMGEQFDPTTFRAAFDRYMATNPLVTLNHSLSKVLGKLTAHRFTPHGVEVEAEIPRPDPGMPELMNAYRLVKSGVLKAFSVGGRWKRRPGASGVEKVFPIEVVECAIAGVPVNPATLFEVVGVKALGGNLDDELSRLSALTAGSSPLDDALNRLRGL
jgi:phage head maturation protease